MPKIKKYYPDYAALYPNTPLTCDVLAALRESDQKMKYMEYDLKRERARKDETGAVIGLIPSREDSFERLLEADKQFAGSAPSPEQVFFGRMDRQSELTELHRCLALLDAGERELIEALFLDGLSEREYARVSGLPKTTVHKRKVRILRKLKNYSNFSA